jgi:predicted nuclease with TOPRIM domain
MSWNIFKRIAELENHVKDLNDFHFGNSRRIKAVEDELSQLEKANKLLVNSNQALIGRHENIAERVKDIAHELVTQSRQPSSDDGGRIVRLEEKVKQLENKLFIQAVEHNAFSEVDKAREAKRQYQREWYAQNKIKKAAQEKKNSYARAYYARKKGKANA